MMSNPFARLGTLMLAVGVFAVSTVATNAPLHAQAGPFFESRSGPQAGVSNNPTLPQPVHTNRQAFRIPYQYNAAEISRLGAREIRLYGSQDLGGTWHMLQSVNPQTGRFDFRAREEGEYWFAVQTVDRSGQLHPGGSTPTPGLVVIVDTTPPQLTVGLNLNVPGRVSLQWSGSDEHLDETSAVLEFTQTGFNGWQQVGVKPSAAGTTSWTIPTGGLVAVRGTIRDLAGNSSSAQDQIQVSGGSGNGAGNREVGPRVPDLSGPVASGAPRGFAGNFGNPPLALPGPGAGIGNAGNGIPGTASPQWDGQFVSVAPGTGSTGEIPAYQTPRKDGPRVVNSRRFEIDYRVDDVGPSGLGSVELFVTQNQGEKWYRYGADEDRRSPFEVEVPTDGIYGFALRVVSGAGLTDPPPQPGDRPEIVINVDSSPPVVQLFPLRQGQGTDSNRILISWQAADQSLADRPIALSYSTNPDGPWEQITGWHPNTGQFIWTVSARVPPRLFVRIVARDLAGNMARVDTPQPVLVDLSRPSARIVDVESAGDRSNY